MKNTFEINGKTYEAVPFTFNTICDLEDMGFNIEHMESRPISAVRAYLGVCMGDKELAGNEIEAHLINGGDLNGVMDAITKEVESSGFFKAMAKNTEEVPTLPKKTTTTKAKK